MQQENECQSLIDSPVSETVATVFFTKYNHPLLKATLIVKSNWNAMETSCDRSNISSS